MVLTQYGSIFVVFLCTLMLVPAVVLKLTGKSMKYYGMILNVPMLILLLGFSSLQMEQFLIFIICELILIWGFYLYVRSAQKPGTAEHEGHKWVKKDIIYFIVLFCTTLPIIVVKGCVYTPYNALGFVGISYISFRIWQLIIEIKDGHIEKFSFLNVLYFITFFPTLSSGPIDRYHRFIEELDKNIPRKKYMEDYLLVGIKRILSGAVYKFGIAFLINEAILLKLPEAHTWWSVLIYMYGYTLYLFFDFAGYSHFAIGTSYILGIKVGENFNKPFLARNMKEFWERWHISLSQWFGDYIYKRFVLNTLRKDIFKNKKTASRCGNMITMLVMGIWHGPYLFYILYGLYEGMMLVVTDIYLKSKFYKKYKKSKYYDIVSRVICFQFISLGMLIFSGYLLSK